MLQVGETLPPAPVKKITVTVSIEREDGTHQTDSYEMETCSVKEYRELQENIDEIEIKGEVKARSPMSFKLDINQPYTITTTNQDPVNQTPPEPIKIDGPDEGVLQWPGRTNRPGHLID